MRTGPGRDAFTIGLVDSQGGVYERRPVSLGGSCTCGGSCSDDIWIKYSLHLLELVGVDTAGVVFQRENFHVIERLGTVDPDFLVAGGG
jgi:hypothetical protein